MKPPGKLVPVRLVETDEQAPSDGDWEHFRQRRLRKYGPPPSKPTGPPQPLFRERLASRDLAAVVNQALSRPPQYSPWHAILLVIGFGAVVLLGSIITVIVRTIGR